MAPIRVGEDGADLVGDGDGDNTLFERHGGVGLRDEDEAAEHVAAPSTVSPAPSAGRENPLSGPWYSITEITPLRSRRGSGWLNGNASRTDSPRNDNSSAELGLGDDDRVCRGVATGLLATVEPGGSTAFVSDALAGAHRMATECGELTNRQSDSEEQQGRLDVVSRIDLQVRVGHGAGEVEGQRGGRRQRPLRHCVPRRSAARTTTSTRTRAMLALSM